LEFVRLIGCYATRREMISFEGFKKVGSGGREARGMGTEMGERAGERHFIGEHSAIRLIVALEMKPQTGGDFWTI
jgi:hypothetical protein